MTYDSLRRLLATTVLLLPLVAACGDDGSNDDETDATADAAEDTAPDADDDVAEAGADADAGSDAAPDADEDPDGSEDTDVDEGPCPGSLLCLNEISGNPSDRICEEAGFPAGTECERTGDVACCVPPFACETDADCEAAREDEGFCLDERYPCTCDVPTGACSSYVCTANADCGDGEVCLDGLCETPPATEGLVARILTPDGIAHAGESLQVVAVAIDPADPGTVVADAALSWTIDAGENATVDPDGLVTMGTTATTVRVQVADNDADTGATVTFAPAPAAVPDTVTVWVIDENRRTPIEGATVWDGEAAVLTDENGVARVGAVNPPVDVHVFAEGYAYVSVYGVSTPTLAVSVPAHARALITQPPNAEACVPSSEDLTATYQSTACGGAGEPACLCFELENVDVVAGSPSFATIPDFGDTEVTISGFSLGNSLLDLNFDLILGPSIDRELGPPINTDGEIPSGVTLTFNGERLIPSFVATAPAGSRSLWTIGGRIALNDILLDILGAVGGDIDIGQIIATVLPFFENFYSDVTPRIDLAAEGTFPVRDPGLELAVPTQRPVAIDLPGLPTLDRGWADTAIVLGGVLVPGEGFVPLGITGGSDATASTDADGQVDGDEDTDAIDPLRMAMAPMHGPTLSPSSRYMFAAVSLLLDDYDGAPREASSGAIVVLEPGAALPETITFDEGFPAFALGSAWGGADGDRTLTIAEADTSFDLYRVVFRDENDHLWIAYAPGDASTIRLPAPTETLAFEDRAARNRVNVVGVTLRDDVAYSDVLTADATNLTDLFSFVSGFSILGL